jgi:hypothetical protein
LLFAEEIMARAFGMESGVIEQSAHFCIAAFASQNIELFFRADEIARKTKQLEEKSAALGVGRIVAHFGIQSLNRVVESPGLKELLD